MLATFEAKGPVLYGDWGTSPEMLEDYLIKEGYNIKSIHGEDLDDKNVKELQEEYDTFIVTVYNDKNDINAVIHTMSVTCEIGGDNNQKYYIHNTFDENLEGVAYDSIESAVAAYKSSSQIINIIGIRKKE